MGRETQARRAVERASERLPVPKRRALAAAIMLENSTGRFPLPTGDPRIARMLEDRSVAPGADATLYQYTDGSEAILATGGESPTMRQRRSAAWKLRKAERETITEVLTGTRDDLGQASLDQGGGTTGSKTTSTT